MGTPAIGLFAPSAWPAMDRAGFDLLGPTAEAAGFESIWLPEHVATFDARSPDATTKGTFDPFVALAYLAARTTTIGLGTGVTLVSQHPPMFFAKTVASLDQLSNGRVRLGVGVGWIREEFEVLGLRRGDRGRLADRALALLDTLWHDDVSTVDVSAGVAAGEVSTGAHGAVRVEGCRSFPKPVQRPMPVHVGGHSDAALRRVVRAGRGWYAFGLDVATFAERLGALRTLMANAGREMDELEITVCPFRQPADVDAVRRYAEAGAHRVILFAGDASAAVLGDEIERLAHDVVEKVR